MGKLLLVLAMMAASLGAADATGKWVGTLSVPGEGGGDQSKPAMLVLKQQGTKLTGTAGPDEGEQHEINEGKVDGARLIFQLTDKGMKFDLKQEGDEITGTLTRERDGETQTAKITVKRQPK